MEIYFNAVMDASSSNHNIRPSIIDNDNGFATFFMDKLPVPAKYQGMLTSNTEKEHNGTTTTTSSTIILVASSNSSLMGMRVVNFFMLK
jgi:hypothetical protein